MAANDQRTRRDTGAASSAVAYTVGVAIPLGGKALLINCTGAGSAVIQFQDGSTVTVNLAVGLYEFNWAVIQIVSSTATAQFWNLV